MTELGIEPAPFPGVPVNATMALVPELAAAASRRFYGITVRAGLLPTEWQAAPRRLEDLLADEEMVVTITRSGYIKRTHVEAYRSQRRGGKGVTGMETKEEDIVEDLFIASTHSYLLFFTNLGKIHWLKVHEIPDVGPGGKGKAIANLVSMAGDEKIAALQTVKEFEEGKFIAMGTLRGVVKKTELAAFSNPRAGGIIAMGIEEGDAVMAVQLSDGSCEIFIGTRDGKAIRFPEEEVRPMGRTAYGVRGIQLREGDQVVAMQVARPGGRLLTVTERGYAKQTELAEYRVTGRGGLGVKNVEITDKNGPVVNIAQVHDEDELLVITEQGKILRTPGNDIRTAGRATQGVRLMDLEDGDRVVSIALVPKTEEDAAEPAAAEEAGPPPPEGEPGSNSE